MHSTWWIPGLRRRTAEIAFGRDKDGHVVKEVHLEADGWTQQVHVSGVPVASSAGWHQEDSSPAPGTSRGKEDKKRNADPWPSWRFWGRSSLVDQMLMSVGSPSCEWIHHSCRQSKGLHGLNVTGEAATAYCQAAQDFVQPAIRLSLMKDAHSS